ncbi:uncharacterized protein LOC127744749 isoform X1 [Arachis duranensis]|uniref:Uncharacterized protein LOC127744749 isoform X1 n=1 Tax=Arachis duranensis TaxID=130453 RepID=A0A9C6TF26_ARADU|nr:uncharacterized protein LOC127744749 isoform X1 [Arachis duranensis]
MKNPWKLLKLLPILVIKQFFISKAPFFVLGLLVSYDFTENWANSLMMDYLSYSLKSDRITAIITNLQDGVSDIFVIFFSSVSEASTGSFTMMAFCSSGTIVEEGNGDGPDDTKSFLLSYDKNRVRKEEFGLEDGDRESKRNPLPLPK